MSVPKFDEFFPPFMKCLSDGNVHSLSEIRSYCADYYNLSDADRVEPLNNGKSYKLNDRVGWARTYLRRPVSLKAQSGVNSSLPILARRLLLQG